MNKVLGLFDATQRCQSDKTTRSAVLDEASTDSKSQYRDAQVDMSTNGDLRVNRKGTRGERGAQRTKNHAYASFSFGSSRTFAGWLAKDWYRRGVGQQYLQVAVNGFGITKRKVTSPIISLSPVLINEGRLKTTRRPQFPHRSLLSLLLCRAHDLLLVLPFHATVVLRWDLCLSRRRDR